MRPNSQLWPHHQGAGRCHDEELVLHKEITVESFEERNGKPRLWFTVMIQAESLERREVEGSLLGNHQGIR